MRLEPGDDRKGGNRDFFPVLDINSCAPSMFRAIDMKLIYGKMPGRLRMLRVGASAHGAHLKFASHRCRTAAESRIQELRMQVIRSGVAFFQSKFLPRACHRCDRNSNSPH
jgi:hypothetical protein